MRGEEVFFFWDLRPPSGRMHEALRSSVEEDERGGGVLLLGPPSSLRATARSDDREGRS